MSSVLSSYKILRFPSRIYVSFIQNMKWNYKNYYLRAICKYDNIFTRFSLFTDKFGNLSTVTFYRRNIVFTLSVLLFRLLFRIVWRIFRYALYWCRNFRYLVNCKRKSRTESVILGIRIKFNIFFLKKKLNF